MIVLDVDPPRAGESYLQYLERLGVLGQGFAFQELVRHGSVRHVDPPRNLWARMVPTLQLAIELRERMVAAGARGLRIAAAYRLLGGAADSQHKVNAALDLDLLPGDDLGSEFAQVATQLWREHEHLRAGFGTYAPAGALWTRRAHFDTGFRTRCWQGLPGGGWATQPAALVLAPARVERPSPRPTDTDCARQGSRWPG